MGHIEAITILIESATSMSTGVDNVGSVSDISKVPMESNKAIFVDYADSGSLANPSGPDADEAYWVTIAADTHAVVETLKLLLYKMPKTFVRAATTPYAMEIRVGKATHPVQGKGKWECKLVLITKWWVG